MKPGEIQGGLVVETRQEATDLKQAIFDFSWVENAGHIFNKLSDEPPIELLPAEAVLVLSALKAAQNKWIAEPDLRARVIKMYNGYLSSYDS